jgi:HEXXH motif-containing protein
VNVKTVAFDVGNAAKGEEGQLEGLYGAFSCPNADHVGTLDVLVPLIVREYTAALCATFVGRNGQRIAASSSGLIEYLGLWFSNPTAITHTVWDYGFGNMYRSFQLSHADHTRDCAVIAACLAAAGLCGEWHARFEEPTRLRLGRWLLPNAARVHVRSFDGVVAIEYAGPRGRGTIEVSCENRAFDSSACEEQPEIAQHGVQFTFFADEALGLTGFPEFEGRVVNTIDSRMVQVFYDAIDIVKSYTPEYLPWIARVLHQVFLLKPTGQRVESGSVENYLGLIHLSAHPEPLPVAELLVHEATHQYMNVLRKLQPLDDGTDSRTYWSPPVKSHRSISKIIAALHAFGNVELFYRLCAARGLPNQAECERQERIMQEWLDVLIPPTIDNPSISSTGNALCQPLIKKLGR